jgi:thiamine-monophosphate kinase
VTSAEGSPGDTRLGDLGERGVLSQVFPRLSMGDQVLLGPGDDTALLAVPGGRVLATTDAMVRGQDWRDDWSSAADVGHKLTAANLADIAAMGGVATGLLVALAADPDTPISWVRGLTDGIVAEAGQVGASLIGGDLSGAPPGVVMIAMTALGHLPPGGQGTPVRRDGARVGDVVAVAGTLGRSDAGLRLLRQNSPDVDPLLVATHRRPCPPYRQGPAAATAGAHAMIDLSDGLSRDAGRIADASGVGIVLERTTLSPYVDELAPAVGLDAAWQCVLHGGEEHALLAAFAAERALPPGWARIGRVVAGSGVRLDADALPAGGWDHFEPDVEPDCEPDGEPDGTRETAHQAPGLLGG